MKETLLKIALAALVHDIGKFSEGGETPPERYIEDNQAEYQPLWKGHYSHRHVIATAYFIEHHKELLPNNFNLPGWGGGEHSDCFLNLAASHHNPTTFMQRCITQANRLSSDFGQAEFQDQEYTSFSKFRSTRLLSILEALTNDGERQPQFKDSTKYTTCYPLAPLSPDSIFPQKKETITKEQAQLEYQQLFTSFLDDLERLPHRSDDLLLWGEHFDSLLEVYTSQIPAARVGSVVTDVSLYDHSRTTAALAVALYQFHEEKQEFTETELKRNDQEKFLLVSGDFYGIQDFIFSSGGEQQRLRAKLLRGRSFAVSVFSELAAHMVCESLELPFTSVFLNAAGKFHLITANTEEAPKRIKETEQQINQWLYKVSNGQASLGFTITKTKQEQFAQRKFVELWDTHQNRMAEKKFQRLEIEKYGVISGFLQAFKKNEDTLKKQLCPFCGVRASTKNAENSCWLANDGSACGNGSACGICHDHIMLGTNLVKGKRVAIYDSLTEPQKEDGLLEPFFDRYQLHFLKSLPPQHQPKMVKFWQLGFDHDGNYPAAGTLKLINGYTPSHQNQPVTFNEMAASAINDDCGIEALGVLNADVDQLGLMISCGMSDERFTISRMATLSRKLDQFFSLFLPHLLANDERFRNIYTVFAGGDDLFLIGPWNKMGVLASHLRKEWARYVSNNDKDGQLTFSAGITMHKTHEPINKLSEIAEEALEQAKDAGRNRITLFGETVSWNEYSKLTQKEEMMAEWMEKEYLSRVTLYRFNQFIKMATEEQRLLQGTTGVRMEDMGALKWRALLGYFLERNIKKKGEEKEQAKKEVMAIKGWLEQYGAALKIPLWNYLYEQRKTGGTAND